MPRSCALTRDLARPWGSRKRLRVNAIAPGFFESEMTSQYHARYLDIVALRILLGRMGLGKQSPIAVFSIVALIIMSCRVVKHWRRV
jgi:NAD(P)-dependent dehydrogenase (short-subunit alcohol dehydrogenase family)